MSQVKSCDCETCKLKVDLYERDKTNGIREKSLPFGRGSRVEGRGSRVEGRGSRVEGRGSRVEGRGSRVEGRGSRVEGRGSRVEKLFTIIFERRQIKFRVYSSFRFLFYFTLTPSGTMCFLACSRLSLVGTS